MLRRVLNQLARKLDGTPAAATVVARKRAVLFNLLGYAVDKKHFPMNPLMSVRWKSPKVAEAIDRRRVVNPRQARALLDALAEQGPMGRHLVAFFGCIYYAGLRPAEIVMLTQDEIQLPDRDGEWGWFHLGHSAPSTGGAWNETGARRERRHLKHRAVERGPPGSDLPGARPPAARPHRRIRHRPRRPPVPRRRRRPALRHRLRPHLGEGPPGCPDARPKRPRRWPNVPYDLRHARLSTWLNAGVAPAQVAEWAGNSVPVLLRVYAKCLTDSEQTALRRIEKADSEPTDDHQDK